MLRVILQSAAILTLPLIGFHATGAMSLEQRERIVSNAAIFVLTQNPKLKLYDLSKPGTGFDLWSPGTQNNVGDAVAQMSQQKAGFLTDGKTQKLVSVKTENKCKLRPNAATVYYCRLQHTVTELRSDEQDGENYRITLEFEVDADFKDNHDLDYIMMSSDGVLAEAIP